MVRVYPTGHVVVVAQRGEAGEVLAAAQDAEHRLVAAASPRPSAASRLATRGRTPRRATATGGRRDRR